MSAKYTLFGEGSDWTRIGDKIGGQNSSGSLGGIYHDKEGKKALIKKEDKIYSNISEFLGASFFSELAPQHGAKVSLMIPTGKIELPNDGKDVYVKSEFFDNYTDMFKDIEKVFHGKKIDPKSSRTLFMGTKELLFGLLTKIFKKLKYEDFDKIAPTSLLVGDFDMHVGNIGVIREESRAPYLVRIDFGNSFRKLTDKLHPHSIMKHLPGMGATNHFREFPDHLKNNDQFVNELFYLAKQPLGEIIDKNFVELTKYYNKDAILGWAKVSLPDKYAKAKPENVSVDQIKSDFKDRMNKRQDSLKEYAIQIKLGLLIEKDKTGRYKINNPKELEELVAAHQEHFKELTTGKRPFKFRDKNLGSKAKTFVMENIKQTLQAKQQKPYDRSVKFVEKWVQGNISDSFKKPVIAQKNPSHPNFRNIIKQPLNKKGGDRGI